MTTVAVITSQYSDESWLLRAIDGALDVVDGASHADVIVASDDCLHGIVDLLPRSTPIVVIGDPKAPQPHAVHLVTRAWADYDLRALLLAVGSRQPLPQQPLAPPSSVTEARDAQRAMTATRKLAGVTAPKACETTIVEIMIELFELDRAYVLYFDTADGALWSETKHAADHDDRRAVAGLAGFAARTGVAAVAQRAGDDPRFVAAIDDPAGDDGDHVLAQPVFGSDESVHAVMIAVRRSTRSPFRAAETALMARFARMVTAVIDQLSIQAHVDAILDETVGDNLFRRAAIDAYDAPRWGDVVRVSPPWLAWTYRLLVMLLVACAVFVAVGRIATYSTGPAVIRSNARTPITARVAGNVIAVEVESGERVEEGTALARLDDSEQRGSVERLTRELEHQLRNHMLDPTDATADAALRTVRTELEAARTALEHRVIRATTAGVVGDVRVRYGQQVEPGDSIASIIDNAQGLEVIALLPGEDRPRLEPGRVLRLELSGYRYAYQSVVIDSVSSEVIAPSEARRVLGAEVAEGLELRGPVVLVRARLAGDSFTMDEMTFRYHDGMVGMAEVRVRAEPIVHALVPGLRRFR